MSKKWYKQKEATDKIQRSAGYLHYQAKIGNINRKKVNGCYLYDISNLLEPVATEQKTEFFSESNDQYYYDAQTETYMFFGLTDQPAVVRVKREQIDSLVRDYANESGGMTLNQVANKYSLSRVSVKQILSILGKTHDSIPFTAETIAEKDEDSLVADLLRVKEQKVLVKAQKKRMKQSEKLLDDQSLLKHLVSEIADKLVTVDCPLPKHRKVVEKSQKYTCLFGLTDLHIGKRGVDGFNSQVASQRALQTIQDGKEIALAQWGTPDYWIVTCGSDMIHVDNYRCTTEKGTLMDVDTDPATMMSIAYATMERIVLMLRKSAPVKVVAMTGNHDRLLSAVLGMMLKARFNEDTHTEVIDGSEGTAYIRYGNSLLGFTHGDSIKPDKLANIMAGERAKDWGECTGNWEWFTGHRHGLHLDIKESNGCRVWTMPSLSGTDRWHKLMGYSLNRKQNAMFKIMPKSGVVALELVTVTKKD